MFETSYADAMCPMSKCREQTMSFYGEHTEFQPVTSIELRTFKTNIDTRFDHMDRNVNQLVTSCNDMARTVQYVMSSCLSAAAQLQPGPPPTSAVANAAASTMTAPVGFSWQPTSHSFEPSTMVSQPQAVYYGAQIPATNLSMIYTQPVVLPTPPLASSATVPAPLHKARRAKPVPAHPEAVIPDLKKGRRGEGLEPIWKRALAQWYEPDPVSGRPALKDWSANWRKGGMKDVVGMKYLGRQRIAEAWESEEYVAIFHCQLR